VDYVVADAAHDRSAHLAETPSADYHHGDLLLLGYLTDDLAGLGAALSPDSAGYLDTHRQTDRQTH